jgi:arylsulfatase A-like enzyme
MTDQQRFDTLRFVQDELWYYDNVTKIETPNLDRLAQQGAYFRQAYCQCSVCAPARTTLRTGCTVERTGIQHNDLITEYTSSPLFTQRVESLKGLDQLLKEHGGYRSEYYGKWHLPQVLWEDSVEYNDFDYDQDSSTFTKDSFGRKNLRFLDYHKQKGHIDEGLEPGMQRDTFSGVPYTPIKLDPRHSSPTGTALSTSNGFESFQTGQSNVLGVNKLDANYTNSFFIADMAGRALERLVADADQVPFFLTVSFHNPHPPMVPAARHWEPYRQEQDRLFVSHNLYDDMLNADYNHISSVEPKYKDRHLIQEWTALYYALITEIDELIGQLLDKLGDEADNTLIIFTSDHGEMLGAHGKREKNNFYEEAARVPLLLSFPGTIQPNTQVDDLVSHLDVVATILDYAGLSEVDESDGTSLRSAVEGQRYNAVHDESIVVAEWDYRKPLLSNTLVLERSIDERPALMIRKDHWKLMIHKEATSNELDMMFDLQADPFELQNVLGTNAQTATDETVQMAEHLRCLLLEWMQRMDGEEGYYSHPLANYGEGSGDIEELRQRQSWPALDFWSSHAAGLIMGSPIEKDGRYIRNEYLYLGTRTSGSIEIATPYLSGEDASMFRLSLFANPLGGGTMGVASKQCIRIQVNFLSETLPSAVLDAAIHIAHGGTTRIIPLSLAA